MTNQTTNRPGRTALVMTNLSLLFILIAFQGTAQSLFCSASFHLEQVDNNIYNFYADSAGNDKGFHWDFGDGTTSTERNPQHIYPIQANGYVIYLTVYSLLDTSCNNTTRGYVKVYPTCYAAFGCKRSSSNHKHFDITNYSKGLGEVTYLWNFGDGTTSTVYQPLTHEYVTNDLHVITLSIRDSTGCNHMVQDTIFSVCSAVFSYSANGKEVWAHSRLYDTVPVKYTWNFGDGTSDTTMNTDGIGHTYLNDGTYTICLTMQSLIDPTCSDKQCKSITIKQPKPCAALFGWSQDSSNTNQIHITNYAIGSNLIYLWDFGDGTTSSLASPGTHTFLSKVPVICLTIKDTVTNCTDSRCDTVYKNGCVASFNYYKKPGTLTYLFNTQNGMAYHWNFGDGTGSTLQNPTHTFPTDGVYTICLSITSLADTTCKDTYCYTIGGKPDYSCKAHFTIAPDSSTTDLYDFIIYNLSSGNDLGYQWNFGDGNASNQKNPLHDYQGIGPYVICLTVLNDSCSHTYCDTLSLTDTLHHYVPGKFSIKVIDKMTGIKEVSSDKASLQNYPNPFSDVTTINYEIKTAGAIELTVYDILGSKLEVLEKTTKQPGTYSMEWNTQHLQEGMYILQLRVADQVITKKLIRN